MGSIRRRSIVTFSVCAAVLTAVPALAQPWTGTAGVGVEVEDRERRALEEAEVQLRWAEGEADTVPTAATTDADGRASIRGLAPGRWVLTVRHPETMAYVATLRVREGRRPKELNASQVKVGDSLRSLRLRYFEVSGPPERPPVPARPSEPPPEPARTQPGETMPEAPSPVEPPEEVPAETAAPESPDSEPTSTEPEEVSPAPEPVAEEPAEPAAPVEAAPEPPPEEETVPEPAAPEQPDPDAPPSEAEVPPRRGVLRSHEKGTCVECRPGEWAVSSQGVAAGGGDACPGDLESRLMRAAALLGSSRALGPWTGPVELAGGAASVLGDGAYREFTGAVRPVLADDASCRVVALLLPAGATFVGFQYEAAADGDWIRCLPGGQCVVEGSGWSGDPRLTRTPAGTMVSGAFENRGSEPVRVRLTVYFEAPEGWKPR